MGGRRCAHPGCGRFVGREAIWCGQHGDVARRDVRGLGDWAGWAARPQCAAGDGDDAGIGAALKRAAADPGLDDEIGAVRVTLRRLLRDDADPLKVALAVARLAAVAVQAVKTRQTLAEAGANPLQEVVERAAALADGAAAGGEGSGDARRAGGAGSAGGCGAGVDLRGGDAADGGRAGG